MLHTAAISAVDTAALTRTRDRGTVSRESDVNFAEPWVSQNPRSGAVRNVIVSGDYAAALDDLTPIIAKSPSSFTDAKPDGGARSTNRTTSGTPRMVAMRRMGGMTEWFGPSAVTSPARVWKSGTTTKCTRLSWMGTAGGCLRRRHLSLRDRIRLRERHPPSLSASA